MVPAFGAKIPLVGAIATPKENTTSRHTYDLTCGCNGIGFCASTKYSSMWRRQDPYRRRSSGGPIALCNVILGLGRRWGSFTATPDSQCLGQCILHTTLRLAFRSIKFGVRWLVETGFPETRLVNQREAADHTPCCCLEDPRLDLQGGHTYFSWSASSELLLCIRIKGS